MKDTDSLESILNIRLPAIPQRQPFVRPTSHLAKVSPDNWVIKPGRRPTRTLVVDRLRSLVDTWRDSGYLGACDTTRTLLTYWFSNDHLAPEGTFQYYFCQREAVETFVYLYEVAGIRDVLSLITRFSDAEEVPTQPDGKRRIRRNTDGGEQQVEQEIPRANLARFAFKMATGSGKTVTMALMLAWSYFHRKFEPGSELAKNFLIVAPNVIVYERLLHDFSEGRIFRSLPIVPPAWRADWSVETVLRNGSGGSSGDGVIFLTNVQQFYADRAQPVERNPVAAILGERPQSNIFASEPLMGRILQLDNLLVLNDEAHHLHDDELAWNEMLLLIDQQFRDAGKAGLAAWLDFSATPRNQSGMFFPWIVVDYPLAQAVEDRIVKTPLIVHQIDRIDPSNYTQGDAGHVFDPWITAAIERWRHHMTVYGVVGEKPVLFVMAETTAAADSIARRLEQDADFAGRVLTIHVNESGPEKGNIRKSELQAARQAAREVDSGESRYHAVVSVLMLREGWDVRNVSIILGLRPFSSRANILPEQAVGRGLRLMARVPRDNVQVLELIGTKAFEDFVREVENEGVGLVVSRELPDVGRPIFPLPERSKYDIAIPQIGSSFRRVSRNINHLQPSELQDVEFPSLQKARDRQAFELEHGILGVTVHSGETERGLPSEPVESLISRLTNRVLRRAHLPSGFELLYPKVRSYLERQAARIGTEIDSEFFRGILSTPLIVDKMANVFEQAIQELTVEREPAVVSGPRYRVSQAGAFVWRRTYAEATKTVFNLVACYDEFEVRLARFFDEASDVLKFAGLRSSQISFHIQYMRRNGVGLYHPDFVVAQRLNGRGSDEGVQHWLVETRSHRDELEIEIRDQQIIRWCHDVKALTGEVWHYVRLAGMELVLEKYATFQLLLESLRLDQVPTVPLSKDEIAVEVYLGNGDAESIRKFHLALQKLCDAFGLIVVSETAPVWSSWWKRMTLRIRAIAGSHEAREILEALKAQHIEKPKAELRKIHAEAGKVENDALKTKIEAMQLFKQLLDGQENGITHVATHDGHLVHVKHKGQSLIRELTEEEWRAVQRRGGTLGGGTEGFLLALSAGDASSDSGEPEQHALRGGASERKALAEGQSRARSSLEGRPQPLALSEGESEPRAIDGDFTEPDATRT